MYRHHLFSYSFLCLILLLVLCSCNRTGTSSGTESSTKKAITISPVPSSNGCSAEATVRALTQLEEIQAQEGVLNSLFGENTHISYLIDSTSYNEKEVYAITAGYNNEERFETYYHFYIDKSSCQDILVMDVVTGDYISPEEWRNRRN